jgi:hypothetical protein
MPSNDGQESPTTPDHERDTALWRGRSGEELRELSSKLRAAAQRQDHTQQGVNDTTLLLEASRVVSEFAAFTPAAEGGVEVIVRDASGRELHREAADIALVMVGFIRPELRATTYNAYPFPAEPQGRAAHGAVPRRAG